MSPWRPANDSYPHADGFVSWLGFVRFHRDEGGKVTGLSLVADRAWDVRFERVGVR